MNYKEILENKPHNPNYILRDFDENLAKVMDDGYDMDDRTGTGCRYLPGIVTTIDISERVPVTTLRATKWKSMLAEYLWFLTGSDCIGDLREKFGSKVWDSWQKSEWAKSKGLPEDSIGYGYGPNLIKYGENISNSLDWTHRGFNQIDHVINLLKTNPNSRRILFSFFRPDKQGPENTVLDPCHLIYQFIPEPNRKLSCCVYIRSNDLFVGAGSTNLQGAAFYTHMIGQQTGFTPNKLIIMSAHAHCYHNHFDAIKEYLSREEVNSPILKLNRKESIYDYTLDDFELEDYNPHPRIKVDIAV
jgi:thymidylate synthase